MKIKKRWLIEGGLALLGLLACLFCWDEAKDAFLAPDRMPVLKWWGALFMLSVAFYPLTALLFRKFSDKGYIFGKVIGLAVGGWLMWVMASLHIMKFTATNCYVILVICFLANYGLAFFFCKKKKRKLLEFLGISDGSAVPTKAIWYEALFFFVLGTLLYMKCFRPDFSWQTEGGMDFGFMISMYKSDYMPPQDFWYSGTDLNYYYLGQYFCTYLAKISGVSIQYAYNLALMTVGALCVVLSYALVSRIIEVYMKERAEEYRLRGKRTIASIPLLREIIPRFAGILSGCAVTFASTNHYWVYQKIGPALADVLGVDGDHGYWISDPTRYIGWQGDALDQTIHEFPAYSLVLGDLHAHVINIIFVITLLAILYAFLLARKERMDKAVAGTIEKVSLLQEILDPNIIALSFFIGIFQMTNFWDFPIYFVVCGAVILVSNAVCCGFTRKSLLLTAVHAAEFLVISFGTALLFIIHFESMASGIGICSHHTELYQMLIVWGVPIALILCYLAGSIREEIQRRKERLTETEHKNVFFAWLQHLKASDLFLLVMGLCAVGLIILPEIIYVKDIYGTVNERTNTMFKLTYQAFIMFSLCMGAMITRYLLLPKNGRNFVGGAVLLLMLWRNLDYFPYAWESWAGNYKLRDNYVSLDSTKSSDISEADMNAVEWINENLSGRPVIMEAAGHSYRTDGIVYDRISALTGCPTVIGWRTHEWLWKGDVRAVDDRADDVHEIYTCNDPKRAKSLLKKYKVEYIYVGEVEAYKYGEYASEDGLVYEYLRALGDVVYEDTSETGYYPTFIVKVDYEKTFENDLPWLNTGGGTVLTKE